MSATTGGLVRELAALLSLYRSKQGHALLSVGNEYKGFCTLLDRCCSRCERMTAALEAAAALEGCTVEDLSKKPRHREPATRGLFDGVEGAP